MSAPELDPNELEVWQKLLRQLDDKTQEKVAAAKLHVVCNVMMRVVNFTFSKTAQRALLIKKVSFMPYGIQHWPIMHDGSMLQTAPNILYWGSHRAVPGALPPCPDRELHFESFESFESFLNFTLKALKA
jgi:hypothetical protein